MEVARALRASTGSVATWYAWALQNAAEMDEQGSVVVQKLGKRRR